MKQIFLIIQIILSTYHFIIFLIPGIIISYYILKLKLINEIYIFALSTFFSFLISYIVFWIYFISPLIGKITSVIIICSSLAIFYIQREKMYHYISSADFYTPLLLIITVTWFYLSLLFMVHIDINISNMANYRFLHELPDDNSIPHVFSNLLISGDDLRIGFGYFWQYSDRPPLFTAAISFIEPFRHSKLSVYYQLFGTYLQVIWVAGFWVLCRYFNLSGRIMWFIIGSSIFSGLFLIHSTYLWPKLITSFMIFLSLISFLNVQAEVTVDKKYI